MKPILIFALLLSCSSTTFSQELSGVWKGSFTTFNPGENGTTKFSLEFTWKKDKYLIRSHSIISGTNTTVVCKLKYQMITADSINLKETRVISLPPYIRVCLQKMYLKIKKVGDKYIMEGFWRSEESGCHLLGTMSLVKQTKKISLRN